MDSYKAYYIICGSLFLIVSVYGIIEFFRILKTTKKKFMEAIKAMNDALKALRERVDIRMNALSKENVRLREQNEMLRDRLKNLVLTNREIDSL